MSEKLYRVEQILSYLEEGPQRIQKATAGLAPELLLRPPSVEEWPVRDIVAHLHACGDVWGGHILAILAEDHPERRGINPRTWIEQTGYLEQDFDSLFRSYASQRAKLLAVLRTLPPEGWLRSARIVAYGQGFDHSVQFFGEKMARHERTHVRQIEGTADIVRGQ